MSLIPIKNIHVLYLLEVSSYIHLKFQVFISSKSLFSFFFVYGVKKIKKLAIQKKKFYMLSCLGPNEFQIEIWKKQLFFASFDKNTLFFLYNKFFFWMIYKFYIFLKIILVGIILILKRLFNT